MDLAMFHSWWTVVLVILFVAIVVWAWSGKRKKTFEQAARMPLEEDDVEGRTNVAGGSTPRATDKAPKHSAGGKKHG